MLAREQILGIVRHVLNTVGASFVTKGMITGDQLTTVISGIVVVVSVAWSVLAPEKRNS